MSNDVSNKNTEEVETARFLENLILCGLLLCFLAVLMAGCATTRSTAVTTGSDNATVMAAAGPVLTAAQLIQYVDLAEQEALGAWQLYESTKDTSALQQTSWWLQYAAGVAAKIEALSATGS